MHVLLICIFLACFFLFLFYAETCQNCELPAFICCHAFSIAEYKLECTSFTDFFNELVIFVKLDFYQFFSHICVCFFWDAFKTGRRWRFNLVTEPRDYLTLEFGSIMFVRDAESHEMILSVFLVPALLSHLLLLWSRAGSSCVEIHSEECLGLANAAGGGCTHRPSQCDAVPRERKNPLCCLFKYE